MRYSRDGIDLAPALVMNSYLFVSESTILIIVRITTEMIKPFSISVVTLFLCCDRAVLETQAQC